MNVTYAYLVAQQSEPWPDPVRETGAPPEPTHEAGGETVMGLGIAGFWVLMLILILFAFMFLPRVIAKHKRAGQAT